MMNYRTKIKALMEQVSHPGWEFFEACKTQNRKIFPFYCHASLCCCKYINNDRLSFLKSLMMTALKALEKVPVIGVGWYGKI
jgi:hypothetical protein